MMELILYYILPNIALFGGIYLFTLGFEALTWKFIIWYCDEYKG
jgi:hypothetical protein